MIFLSRFLLEFSFLLKAYYNFRFRKKILTGFLKNFEVENNCEFRYSSDATANERSRDREYRNNEPKGKPQISESENTEVRLYSSSLKFIFLMNIKNDILLMNFIKSLSPIQYFC